MFQLIDQINNLYICLLQVKLLKVSNCVMYSWFCIFYKTVYLCISTLLNLKESSRLWKESVPTDLYKSHTEILLLFSFYFFFSTFSPPASLLPPFPSPPKSHQLSVSPSPARSQRVQWCQAESLNNPTALQPVPCTCPVVNYN